jgi:uracil-DNA glycosylase
MTALHSDDHSMHIANLLPWLVEMGADEVLLNVALNRFAAAPIAKVEVPPPRSAVVPKPAVNWKAVAAGAEGLAAAEALAASITDVRLYTDALENFDLHPLKKTAANLCAIGGNLEARILVLGDKPRNAEDRAGEVLAGDTQILAQRMLAAIGLKAFTDSDTVALANVIPWRPPGNRMPTAHEALMLMPFARKLIHLLQPRAILCFGHLPAHYLGGGEDIAVKARGKWVEIERIPALTMVHPEALLKNPNAKRQAWLDLQAFHHKLTSLA